MEPWPPAIEVPPMKTAAITGRRNPAPWVGKKTFISIVSSNAEKAATTPIRVKSLIRVAFTRMPMTRATSGLSPMNMTASPKVCRLRTNQSRTARTSAQRACAGRMPNSRPVKIVRTIFVCNSVILYCSPPANSTVTPYQKNCAARVAMIEGTPMRATIRPLM